jgi:glycosyltransferase involved in cell wall biosynthesis
MGRSPIGDRFRRRLYARPDRYIVPSQAVADQIERMGGCRDRVAVVRNAIPETAPQNREEARRRLGLPADAKVALFVGRLDVRQKGIDLLKQALLRRADWSRRWMLVVVGDGPGRPLLSDPQFGDRGLEVRLAGWSSDVGSFLAAADLVLMPSRWEGVPLVMLEAIAARVPILGSDIDVFREYLPASHRADFASADVPLLMDALTTRDAVGAYAADMKQRGLVWTLDDAGRAFSAALDG